MDCELEFCQAIVINVVKQSVKDARYLARVRAGERKPASFHPLALNAQVWLLGDGLRGACSMLGASDHARQRVLIGAGLDPLM